VRFDATPLQGARRRQAADPAAHDHTARHPAHRAAVWKIFRFNAERRGERLERRNAA